jgi:hypothetical protein
MPFELTGGNYKLHNWLTIDIKGRRIGSDWDDTKRQRLQGLLCPVLSYDSLEDLI